MVEFNIDQIQYKNTYFISELLTLPINRPEIQRDINIEIVKQIIDYQSKRFEERGSFLFIGDLQVAISIHDNSLYLIDGQHRYYAILTELYKIMPEYSISINFIKISATAATTTAVTTTAVTTNAATNIYPTIEEAFILINKYTPIPKYILDCCNVQNMQYKTIIDQFKNYIKREYKSYISESKNPRIPNINLDKMCDKIMDDSILLFQYIKDGKELFDYMLYINTKIWKTFANQKDLERKNDKIRNKPLYAYIQYNLNKDNDWTSNVQLLNEFKNIEAAKLTYTSVESNAVHDLIGPNAVHDLIGPNAVHDLIGPNAVHDLIGPNPTTRKNIPKKIKTDLWKKYYGEVYNALCLICNSSISIENFEAGHIISVAEGGTNIIDNLKPICIGCNRAMGEQNMNTYKEIYYP
jgi:hypothetical protein